jgi:hypothetical protein
MNVKPILFSGPMVCATLEGRKTQHREVLKPQPNMLNGGKPLNDGRGSYSTGTGWKRYRIAVGDLLWVREAWAPVNSECGPGWAYRAPSDFRQPEYDGEDFGGGPSFNYDKYPGSYTMWFGDLLAGSPGHGWRPSIQMPRWASRLTLEVTEVRVQRLREISDRGPANDCTDEGVFHCGMPVPSHDEWNGSGFRSSEKYMFAKLWDSLNEKRGYGWSENPWVAAVSFIVHKQNVDVLLRERAAA